MTVAFVSRASFKTPHPGGSVVGGESLLGRNAPPSPYPLPEGEGLTIESPQIADSNWNGSESIWQSVATNRAASAPLMTR
jgi:hypothetical protein